jgi:formylmethanofuran dehydrogenase subunit C
MEEQKQAKQQMQIDSDILNTFSKAVRVAKEKGNLDRDEYKKGINASKTKALFLLFEDVPKKFDMPSTGEYKLSIASALLKGVNYTIKDIEELCPILSQSYANETNSIGIFISAAINKIIKETDTIVLDFAGIEVNFLGYNLPCGNLIIKGSVGDDIGNHMQSGSITIHGNAGRWTGCSMKGGSIIVEGNAGDYTGRSMHSGSITIRGNADNFTGDYSEGGEIKVNGEINGIGGNPKAAIFCKGKKVN